MPIKFPIEELMQVAAKELANARKSKKPEDKDGALVNVIQLCLTMASDTDAVKVAVRALVK